MLEVFHPHARAFWEPIKFAVVAGLFSGAFGLGVSLGQWWVALIIGSFVGFWVYLFWAIHWFAIVRKSYMPDPPAEVECEEEPLEPDELEYVVTCRVGDTTHHLRFLPCEPSRLQSIGLGYSEGKKLTFDNWLHEFTEAEFRGVIEWMVLNHWLTYNGARKAVTMLAAGDDILRDLAATGIQDALPRPNSGYPPIYRPTAIQTDFTKDRKGRG